MHQGQRHFPSRAMVYYGPGPSLPQWFVKASQAKTETVAVGFELRLGLWLMIRLCDLNSFSSHELDLFSPLACLQLDAIRSSGSVGRKHVGVDGHFSAITTCVKLWSFKQKRWLSGRSVDFDRFVWRFFRFWRRQYGYQTMRLCETSRKAFNAVAALVHVDVILSTTS